VPFSDLASWQISQPVSLIDLVWAPCSLTLNDGNTVHGFMPVRYPGSELASDSLRLGYRTEWKEAGAATVTALGRRTWMTAQEDIGIFELPACRFGEQAATSEDTHQEHQDGDRNP
jgi:type VI secretion system protein ImpE